MRENQFGFHYTWSDLAPIRGLIALVVAIQLIGLAVGAHFPRFPGLFVSAWYGGALVTFPAFVAGLLLQRWLNPRSISDNKRMVWHAGLVSAVLSVVALAMPILGFAE